MNEQAEEFRNRPLTSNAYPVLWVDALYEKVRYAGRVVSMAILLVCGVSEEGKGVCCYPDLALVYRQLTS